MSKQTIKLKVASGDLERMVDLLIATNKYDYVLVTKDGWYYEVEAHIGDEREETDLCGVQLWHDD